VKLVEEIDSDETPEQDVTVWVEILQRLLSDKNHYLDVAKRSKEAAHHYLESFDRRK